MQAQVTPTGATDPVYGTVTDVGLVAEASSSGAATFPVTVTITGAQAKLYAGTTATVSIITKQVSDVLAVPSLALHTTGSTTYVEKLVGGKQGAHDGEGRGDLRQQHRGHLRPEVRRQGGARDPQAPQRQRQPVGQHRFPDGGEGNFPAVARAAADLPTGTSRAPAASTVEVEP